MIPFPEPYPDKEDELAHLKCQLRAALEEREQVKSLPEYYDRPSVRRVLRSEIRNLRAKIVRNLRSMEQPKKEGREATMTNSKPTSQSANQTTSQPSTTITRTIAGREISLESGIRYLATRPMMSQPGRRSEQRTTIAVSEMDSGAVVLSFTCSLDEADAFLAEFNNEAVSLSGRVW